MQLEFKKQNGLYEVEFEVTGNFNLHLERKNYGRIELYQKTSSETNYTSSPSYSANGDVVINLDFSMGIYPKFVKIISYTEVEKAIVTMEGESGGSGNGGAKIVPLIDQCRVTAIDYGDDINADGNTILPDENGVFTRPAIEIGAIRVFTPYLYVTAVADLIIGYHSSTISWNKDKQCFDILIDYLPETFTLSIIE